MATVCLRANGGANSEEKPVPERPPEAFQNWVGGAREWCAAIEQVPAFARALAGSPKWESHDCPRQPPQRVASFADRRGPAAGCALCARLPTWRSLDSG